MKPIRTPDTNVVFKLPGGGPESDLPLARNVQDGQTILVSTWELDAEERKAISQGATLRLVVWGEGTLPVALSVNEP